MQQWLSMASRISSDEKAFWLTMTAEQTEFGAGMTSDERKCFDDELDLWLRSSSTEWPSENFQSLLATARGHTFFHRQVSETGLSLAVTVKKSQTLTRSKHVQHSKTAE